MVFCLCICEGISPINLALNSTSSGNGSQTKPKLCSRMKFPTGLVVSLSSASPGSENIEKLREHKVKELMKRKKVVLGEEKRSSGRPDLDLSLAKIDWIPSSDLVDVAYDYCRELNIKDKDPFCFGILLLKPEMKKTAWAICAWGRRLDELVDGINRSHNTPEVLDRWEQRLIDIFEGRPWDIYDVALSDTISKYPFDIQPFKDVIEASRFDMMKNRFENFDQLYNHYYLTSAFLLMGIQMWGVVPESKVPLESVYSAAIDFGVALGLIDVLRDVGEDARIGRICLPQDEMALAGLTNDDIFSEKVTDKWRNFMKGQIKRARTLLDESGEKLTGELHFEARWAMWTSMLLYRQDLDAIEANGYNNFTIKAASVGKTKKLVALLVAYGKSLGGNPSSNVIDHWSVGRLAIESLMNQFYIEM